MIEIRKISVEEIGTNHKIIDGLSLKIRDGKMEVIDGDDPDIIRRLSDIVRNKDEYIIKIDDVLLDKKPFRDFFSNKKSAIRLFHMIREEFNLMCQNKFRLLNSSQEQKDSFLEYVSRQIDECHPNTMEKIGKNLCSTVFPEPFSLDPSIHIKQEESQFDIDHFTLSVQVLGNSGFSLIQLLGLLIGIGLIILTSIKVYGAAVNANSVSYSNSSSNLVASNVQEAIDETYRTVTWNLDAAKYGSNGPGLGVAQDPITTTGGAVPSKASQYNPFCKDTSPIVASRGQDNFNTSYLEMLYPQVDSNTKLTQVNLDNIYWYVGNKEISKVDSASIVSVPTNVGLNGLNIRIQINKCSNSNFYLAYGPIYIKLKKNALKAENWNQPEFLYTGFYKGYRNN